MAADIKSILIYFGALGITLLCLHHCSKAKTQNRMVRFFGVLITALPLSLLAGLKALSVGTDSYNYMLIFQNIYNDSFADCLIQSDFEKIFVLLVKVISVFFGKNDAFVFFGFECISLIILIYSLLKLKDKLNPCVAFFLYFLVFYHTSLNIVRQGLAISLIALLIVKLVEKKYFQSAVVLFLAINVHLSSIIAVLFIFAAAVLKKYRNLSAKRIFYFFILAVMLGTFSLSWNYIIALPIFSSYSKYVTESYDIGIGVFVSGFIYFAFPLILSRNEIFSNYETEVLFDISIMYIPIAFMGYFSEHATRLNLFPQMAIILFLAHLIHKIKIPSNRRFMLFFYFALFIIEYIVNYMISNQTNAYPYVFNVL